RIFNGSRSPHLVGVVAEGYVPRTFQGEAPAEDPLEHHRAPRPVEEGVEPGGHTSPPPSSATATRKGLPNPQAFRSRCATPDPGKPRLTRATSGLSSRNSCEPRRTCSCLVCVFDGSA